MPITIDGNGTIGGITAGGLPDGTVDTDVLAANAVTEAKLGSDEQKGLAKAWVNFNGTGTVAIRSSFNVSSITDNATGRYIVNFSNSLANANYSVTLGNDNAGSNNNASYTNVHTLTTSSFGATNVHTAAFKDISIACFVVFGA